MLSLDPYVYNSKMLLNLRRNLSYDQKVFKRLVLHVGDNCKFRIYLTESVTLSCGHSVLIRTVCSFLQDRFRKQSGFPSSVAFCYSAQVAVSSCGAS